MTKVLLADDDPTIRLELHQMLEQRGLSVVSVSNADELIRQFELTHPDIVVTDDHMPPGKRGRDALKELRSHERYEHCRFILYCGMPEVGEAEALGVEFITKPNLPALVAMIEDAAVHPYAC